MKDFDKRLQRLEEISASLRDGDFPLEEAMKLFEEGIRLAKSLEKDLSKVEKKIEILVNNPEPGEDEPHLELFPELDNQPKNPQEE